MGMPTRTVLMIDDNEHDRVLVERILQGNDKDWAVEGCATGLEGMRLLRRQKFTCILLDYRLPDKDGVDVLKDLRRCDFETPVVMLTGSGGEDVAIEAFKNGAQDYVVKSSVGERDLIGVMEQAIQRKADEISLIKKANFDSLTGLVSRSLLPERIDQAIARSDRSGAPFALAYIDLNGFKTINDTYGHEAGDAVLKEVGARLDKSVRQGDTVSRLGGDEFVAVIECLAGDGMESCNLALERIRVSLNTRPYAICGQSMIVTASIGAAIYPFTAACRDELLRVADLAMYECKRGAAK